MATKLEQPKTEAQEREEEVRAWLSVLLEGQARNNREQISLAARELHRLGVYVSGPGIPLPEVST